MYSKNPKHSDIEKIAVNVFEFEQYSFTTR